MLELFRRKKEDIENKIVLEVGCGYGWFLAQVVDMRPAKVFGTDSCPDAIAVCKTDRKIAEKVILTVQDSRSLPFQDAVFDSIFAWEVLEHLPKHTELDFFRELARVIKPGGIVYLSTPNRSLLGNLLDPAWYLTGHRHYSTKDLELFYRKNFSKQEILVRGGIVEVLFILNLYIAKWIFRRKPFFESSVNLLDREWLKQTEGFTNIFLKLKRTADVA